MLWGHTLVTWFGLAPTNIGIVMHLLGAALIIAGWRAIYRDYWSKERGEGKLVTTGIYRFIRHPQYTGFFLITLGMIFEWATLPTAASCGRSSASSTTVWPAARRRDMRAEFGFAYDDYADATGMFLPTKVFAPHAAARVPAVRPR